jgi:DNA-directed RNA polymerase subunit RPC12/RpoP
MELKCPECGATIAESDVNLKAGIASCPSCSTMLVIMKRGEELVASPADTVAPRDESAVEEEQAPAPSFTCAEQDDVLTVTFPPCGFGQGWRLLSVALFALVFAAVLAREVLIHRPPAFFMFVAGAVLLAVMALVVAVAGFYVTFGRGAVTLSRTEAVFARTLFGLTWRERASMEGVARVEPFRARQRARIELFTCGLVVGERRYKFFRDLGDADMFRVAERANGFLKRIHAEDFSSLLTPQAGPTESESPDDASS